MDLVKYVRRRSTTETSRRASSRVASRRPTATKTLSRPEGSEQSKPNIQKKTTYKANTSISSPKMERVPKSQDYLGSDELVGWKYYASTKHVDILTRRPADGSERLVPEKLIQQRCPSQLYTYWKSFHQPREETIKTNYYHVFDVIEDDSSRGLKVQWVGYPSSEKDTTWEPSSKIRKMNPELLHDYILRKQVNDGPARICESVATSKSDITDGF